MNESSSSKQLKLRYSNAHVLTADKLNQLKEPKDCDYPDLVCIAEVKPKNFIRTSSLVEYYINGYNLEAIRGMLIYLRKCIQYHVLEQLLFANILTREIIICELRKKDSYLLAIACVSRSTNSTVNNEDNLNVLLKNTSDKYNANLIVLGDFNYPRIDWVHYNTNSSIND